MQDRVAAGREVVADLDAGLLDRVEGDPLLDVGLGPNDGRVPSSALTEARSEVSELGPTVTSPTTREYPPLVPKTASLNSSSAPPISSRASASSCVVMCAPGGTSAFSGRVTIPRAVVSAVDPTLLTGSRA